MPSIRKIWDFIWNSNSVWSWILNIILAFILIKFIVYPGIGLVLGTNLPIVAVISESMEHEQGDLWFTNDGATCSFGPCRQKDWYAELNITEENFSKFPLNRGFNKGDLMILIGRNAEDIKVGDIIVFERFDSDAGGIIPVIHRVVKITVRSGKIFFQTKGDNNLDSIIDGRMGLNEMQIPSDKVLGLAGVKIPWLGWVKIKFSEWTGIA